MKSFSKIIFPGLVFLAGVVMLILSVTSGQNKYVVLSAIILALIGVIMLVIIFKQLQKSAQLGIIVFFIICSFILTAWNIQSIKEPLDFAEVKNERFEVIKQSLKDIREAQIMYKKVYGDYTQSFDTLSDFIKNGKLPVVRAIGDRPDGLTVEEALKQGYMRRDTNFVLVKDTLFGKSYVSKFGVKTLQQIDSIGFIPYTNGVQFNIIKGEVEKNNLKVKTLQVTAKNSDVFSDWPSHFYQDLKDQSFGSTTDPVLNGNWE